MGSYDFIRRNALLAPSLEGAQGIEGVRKHRRAHARIRHHEEAEKVFGFTIDFSEIQAFHHIPSACFYQYGTNVPAEGICRAPLNHARIIWNYIWDFTILRFALACAFITAVSFTAISKEEECAHFAGLRFLLLH